MKSQQLFVRRQRAFEQDWHDYLAAVRRDDQVLADELRDGLAAHHGLELRRAAGSAS